MKNAMVLRILALLKERTNKYFSYEDAHDYFYIDTEGLDDELIRDIQSVFAGQTYGVYEWRVVGSRLIIAYFLCDCNGCMKIRNELREKGEWIGDDEE